MIEIHDSASKIVASEVIIINALDLITNKHESASEITTRKTTVINALDFITNIHDLAKKIIVAREAAFINALDLTQDWRSDLIQNL